VSRVRKDLSDRFSHFSYNLPASRRATEKKTRGGGGKELGSVPLTPSAAWRRGKNVLERGEKKREWCVLLLELPHSHPFFFRRAAREASEGEERRKKKKKRPGKKGGERKKKEKRESPRSLVGPILLLLSPPDLVTEREKTGGGGRGEECSSLSLHSDGIPSLP